MFKLLHKLSRILKFVFSRKFVVVILLALQLFILFGAFFVLAEYYRFINMIFLAISLVLVIHILNRNENPAYKIAWIIPLLLVPFFTAIFYIFVKAPTALFISRHHKKVADTKDFLSYPEELAKEVKATDDNLFKTSKYMWDWGHYPTYKNSRVTYFPWGEDKFAALKEELKKAEKFIFLEYFIIKEGKMWGEILDILKEKADSGVDIRLLYDGFGSQMFLPDGYHKKLRKMGIKVKIFNKFTPFLSTSQNNRDHRKIVVIDGKVAFSGGINLADEYINAINRFGKWKDSAIMIKGEAVWSYTIMFLQLWELDEKETEDYTKLPPSANNSPQYNCKGYVMPYSDSPLDNEPVGELVYLDIINNAKDYLYITTPYLIPGSELISALTYAAKSGVDVRIIMPGIPDKRYVFYIGQSYYKSFIDKGIKIYEYTPGFIHSKNFVSDDKTAVVGSINLDYRSLYLHFECATLLYGCECVKDVKSDFLETLKDCREIDDEYCRKRPIVNKILGSVLKILAPLL